MSYKVKPLLTDKITISVENEMYQKFRRLRDMRLDITDALRGAIRNVLSDAEKDLQKDQPQVLNSDC